MLSAINRFRHMTNSISLTCPSCGGKLLITEDIDRFVCVYCGNEHIVKRGDGIISLQPIISELKNVKHGVAHVQQGVDRTASELAIRRLQDELTLLRSKRAIKHNVWQGEKARMGCFGFYASIIPAITYLLLAKVTDLIPFRGSSIIAVLTFLLPLVVLGFVTYFVNLDKNEIIKNQNDLDTLISIKEQELEYHRDLVARR